MLVFRGGSLAQAVRYAETSESVTSESGERGEAVYVPPPEVFGDAFVRDPRDDRCRTTGVPRRADSLVAREMILS